MEQPPCVLISFNFPILAGLLGFWIAHFAFHLGYWTYTVVHNISEPFVVLPQRPTGYFFFSPIAWVAYTIVVIAQLSPFRSFWHLRSPEFRIVESEADIILTIGIAVIFLFFNPEKVPGIAPLFLLLMWEYIGLIVYLFVFALHMPGDTRERMWFPTIYHEFMVHAASYIAVIIAAAALYRANPTYLDMKAISAWDALYFSVVTITTVGYGDILPTGCLRIVSAGEVLIGLFIVVILLGVTIGRIVSILSASNTEAMQNDQI